MYFIKLKNIKFTEKITNRDQIKRDLNHRYGPVIDNMILWLIEDVGLKNAEIMISPRDGEWFKKYGSLDINVRVKLLNDDERDLYFILYWNHTSFITDKKVISDTEWW